MKKIFTIIFILLDVVCYSQKLYEFDYIIEYEVSLFKDSIRPKKNRHRVNNNNYKRYYLINSKQNEYFAVIYEKDSLNYQLIFDDHKRKVHSKSIALKSDLNDADLIEMNCKNVFKSMNGLKTKDYDFLNLKDTLINNKSLSLYKYNLKNQKKRKRKKIGSYYYIIDKSSNFNLPLFVHPNLFEKWQLNNKISIGFIKEKYYKDYYEKLRFTEKFVGFIKTDKKIYIPKSCGLTELIIDINLK